MSPKPTGRLAGNDLIITRSFRAPIEDVWTSVTTSESTARWFGPWEYVAGGDDTKVRIQMAYEEGKPWMEGKIEVCEAPRHLAITTTDSSGVWHLELKLTESAGTTTIELVHHLSDRKGMGEVGPGWEYYLDMLVAARAGAELPKFDAYYPAQKEYFTTLASS